MTIEKNILEKLMEFFSDTPKAMAVAVVAFLIGHLWVFVITTFVRSKTKGNRMLSSPASRVTIGLAWLTAIFIPLYRFSFGDYAFEYDKILQIVIPTIVFGLFAQLILFIIFLVFGDRK